MKKKIYYILPSYNESLNLDKNLNDFKKFFIKKKVSVNIIICCSTWICINNKFFYKKK